MGPTALLPLRRKCVLGIFIAHKNPPSLVGFEPATKCPVASTLTTKPPRAVVCPATESFWNESSSEHAHYTGISIWFWCCVETGTVLLSAETVLICSCRKRLQVDNYIPESELSAAVYLTILRKPFFKAQCVSKCNLDLICSALVY
jgi:hypothetical protein